MTDTTVRAAFDHWWQQERIRTWREAGCDVSRGNVPSSAWAQAFENASWVAWQAALSAPPAEPQDQIDAKRYRWLKANAKLQLLDDGIDSAMKNGEAPPPAKKKSPLDEKESNWGSDWVDDGV